MERVCFLLKVKGDRLAEYRQRHKTVWPEMLAALRETGWHNYSLFLREDGLLVGYFETPDLEAARDGLAGRESMRSGKRRWRRFLKPWRGGARTKAWRPWRKSSIWPEPGARLLAQC